MSRTAIAAAFVFAWIGLYAQQGVDEQPRIKQPGDGSGEAKDAARGAILSASASFVPMVPCRVADTRQGGGKSGAFGPPTLQAGVARTIPVGQSSCGIPPGAIAYFLNFTVIPHGRLSFLTVSPTGQPRPNVSTLNSFDGRVTASMAVVPAGTNGAIDVFVTDQTDVVVDITGAIVTTPDALPFRFMPPCRVMDTRVGEGKSGVFGPPLMAARSSRSLAIPLGGCAGIPPTSRAYLLNVTVVPRGPLSFLTVWPAGLPRPLVSTLNSFQGQVVANAVVVAAGKNAMIDIYVSNSTDVIIDINGYMAP